MGIQILGQDGSSIVGADATQKALRATLRPQEALAWQSVGAKSGLITGVSANSPLFSLRNSGTNNLLVRRIGVGFVTTTAFTTAQLTDFALFIARSFSASDSGGTAIALTGNNAKHRTSLAAPTSLDMRIATIAALTAGTRTLDTNQVSNAAGWSGAAGAGVALALDNLLKHDASDYPLVLAANEGLVIANLTAFGAAGVGNLFVNIEFAEAATGAF